MIEPRLVFENKNVDSSSHMSWPEKTGEYLVFIKELGGEEHFTEVYFRADTKNFYFHLWCEKDKTLPDYWRCQILYWIILKEISLDDFDHK